MNKNQKSSEKENITHDKGKLADMNDSSATKGEKSTTGTAKDEGTLGKMNSEAEKK